MRADATDEFPETLSEHQAFLRRLARSLTSDEHASEDVVQQTWITALERPGNTTGSLRGWLAGVTRNLAWRQRRGDQRRRRRERMVATREVPHEANVERQIEVQRLVAEALSALQEPYRTAVFLRYFRDLTPTEIATQLSVPLPTVKSRLRRGLALLRESLDGQFGGDRRAWCTALFPLAGTESKATWLTLGGIAVGMKTITLILAATMLLGVYLFRSGVGSGSNQPTDGETVVSQPESPGIVNANKPITETARSEVASDSSDPTPSPPPLIADGVEPTTMRGRVIDNTGRGIAGWIVNRYPKEPGQVIVTGVDGLFKAPVPASDVTYSVQREGFVTVVYGSFKPDQPNTEPLVMVAPAIRVTGRARTPDGSPVHGEVLYATQGERWDIGLGIVRDGSRDRTFTTMTEDDGSFVMDGIPAIPGATLFCKESPVYERMERLLPQLSTEGLDVVFQPKVATSNSVRGRVLDPKGMPVVGANVALGIESTRSDDTGAFQVPMDRALPTSKLVAALTGRLPAVLENPNRGGPWPPYVELTIGEDSLTMRGQVVEADGTPVPGASVWLEDPTYFGGIDNSHTFLEPLLSGKRYQSSVTADEQGRFTLSGLVDRAYTLGSIDGKTLRKAVLVGARAGRSDVSLRYPERTAGRIIAGRVLSRRGDPVGGVRIGPNRVYFVPPNPDGSPGEGGSSFSAYGTETGEDGTFLFDDVRGEVHGFYLDGEKVMPGRMDLPANADLSDLTIVPDLRCHIQVELNGEPRNGGATYDGFFVHDAKGHPLDLVEFQFQSSRGTGMGRFVDGKSQVWSCSDAAAEIVLVKDWEVVHRQSLSLTPGELNDIDIRP